MLILFVENVGNFQYDARDGIVVLTLIAWAAIVTSASKVSYDHQQRRGIVGSRFFYTNLSMSLWGYTNNINNRYEQTNHTTHSDF